MSQTALTLVNRLLRRHRMDDVSAFTSPEAVISLELINTSIRELLGERDYPWNIRHDGQLATSPGRTGTLLTTTNGSVNFVDNSITTTTSLTGSYCTRLIVGNASSPSDYAATAFRVASVSLIAGVLRGTFASAWPLTNNVVTPVTSTFVVYEYVLPDTVAKVLSVRHEETPVRLVEIPPTGSFEDIIPRPWERRGTPELVATGGQAVSTYLSTSESEGTRGLRLSVWPTPESTEILTYSYKERFTALSATTDSLGAPDEFCDDVIERADAKAYSTAWGNDPDLARLKLNASLVTANQKYTNSRLDPQRRHVVQPLDSGAGRKRDPTLYRDITGL